VPFRTTAFAALAGPEDLAEGQGLQVVADLGHRLLDRIRELIR
jgi:hypothetical protein